MHQPIQGGVRGAPGQAGARGWHPQPHAVPASPVPSRPTETSLRRPPRDGWRWLWRRGHSSPCRRLRAPWGEGQLSGGSGALGAAAAHGHRAFIRHAGHATPGGVSPGTRRQGGTPGCPAEQLGPRGMFWKFTREARGKGEDWIDPFFPLPFTCLQIFIRLFSCRAKCFFIVPSKALLPNSGCSCGSCNPSPKACTPLVWEQFGRSAWEHLLKSGGEAISASSKAPVHSAPQAFSKGFCQLSLKQFAKMHVVAAKCRHRALTARPLQGPRGAGLRSTFQGHPRVQGAGCKLLSSRDGIYQPVNGSHKLLMRCWEAGGGAPGVKSGRQDAASTAPSSLPSPRQASRRWHPQERGRAAPTSGEGARTSWRSAALPSPGAEDKGVTFLQAELDAFMACLGLVFSLSLFFFFTLP